MAATVSQWRYPLHYLSHNPLPKSPSPQTLIPSQCRFHHRTSFTLLQPFTRSKRPQTTHPAAIANEHYLIDKDQIPQPQIQEGDFLNKPKPCELYLCNLPRTFDISQIADLLTPFGSILSIEVSKDPQTGLSRGCAYATMSSIASARTAVRALDGSDVGGREMRVRYGAEMRGRGEVARPEAMNSAVTKTRVYEGAYQVYVGNLAWGVSPDELRERFCEFGRVIGVRLMYDRREGKKRVFGFVSFDRESEREAALAADRTVFQGRSLVVRSGVKETNQQ